MHCLHRHLRLNAMPGHVINLAHAGSQLHARDLERALWSEGIARRLGGAKTGTKRKR